MTDEDPDAESGERTNEDVPPGEPDETDGEVPPADPDRTGEDVDREEWIEEEHENPDDRETGS